MITGIAIMMIIIIITIIIIIIVIVINIIIITIIVIIIIIIVIIIIIITTTLRMIRISLSKSGLVMIAPHFLSSHFSLEPRTILYAVLFKEPGKCFRKLLQY